MHTSKDWGWRRLRLAALATAALTVGLLLAGSSSAAVTHGVAVYSQTTNFDGSAWYSTTYVGATYMADDFIVPAATSWQIAAVYAAGVDARDLASVTVTIYSDSSGSPGTEVYTTTVNWGSFDDVADPYWTSWTGGDLTIPVDVTLASGHYWLSVVGNGADWFWDSRNVVSNDGAMFKDPTNRWGTGCTTWGDVGTCYSQTSVDLMFALYGPYLGDVLTPTNGRDLNGTEGAALNGRTLGTFTDTNTSAIAADFTTEIDWGDGTTGTGTVSGSTGNFTVTGSHTYTEEGDYTVTTDVSGNSGTATINTLVHVADAPITLSNPKLAWKTARMSLDSVATLTVKFTDANRYATADDFTGTVDWGDGTNSFTFTAAGGRSWVSPSLTHVYARGSTYAITITVYDTGGESDSIQKTGTVR